MEKKIQIGKRLGNNREWKAVADYRKWKKSLQKKKQLWKAARQLRRIWKKGPEKRLKKAQKAFYKKLMRDLKKFNRKKTVKNRRRRIR